MSFHPDSNLPGCMMPDGGDCCVGYQALLADWRRLRAVAQHAPFYGAQCPSYPNCNGGCGLGCTKEIERSRHSAQTSGGRAELNELDRAIGIFGRATTETHLDPSDRYDAVKHVRDYLLELRGRLSGIAQRQPQRDEMGAAALARIAAANLSDPETDDLTVPLALALGDAMTEISALRRAASPPAALPAGENLDKIADDLIGIQEDLTSEDARNHVGVAVHYLRVAASSMPSTQSKTGED